MTVAYIDTSALAKLLVDEPGSEALKQHVHQIDLVSSMLSMTELHRALRRLDAADAHHRAADDLLTGIMLLSVDEGILRRAAAIGPPTLRTLDAIHLATAARVAPDLDELISYDQRLLSAAAGLDLRVAAPGTA